MNGSRLNCVMSLSLTSFARGCVKMYVEPQLPQTVVFTCRFREPLCNTLGRGFNSREIGNGNVKCQQRGDDSTAALVPGRSREGSDEAARTSGEPYSESSDV